MRARVQKLLSRSAVYLGAVALLVGGLPGLANAQETRSRATAREGGSRSSAVQSRGSSSSQAGRAVPRGQSGGSSGRGSATTNRHHGGHSGRGGSQGGRADRQGGRAHHRSNYWGLSFGYGGWGHGYYPYYYYGLGYPYWGHWEPYWYRYRVNNDVGAVDLNVRPKKTQVYVDGSLVGTTGKFDGFPGFLWLDKGAHELVFYYGGFATEVRKVRVMPGVVIDLDLNLEPGATTPAEELMTQRGPEIQPQARERRAAVGPAAPAAPEARSSDELDVREAPGRFQVVIEPGDSSVYLDGRFLGTAAEMSRLHDGLIVDAGSHVLEVVRPGYESERLDFFVEVGGSIDLEVSLRPVAAATL